MFDYPKRNCAVQFNCTFHNRHQGTNTFILGRDATIEVESAWCRLYEAEWKPESSQMLSEARKQATASGLDPELASAPPIYSLKKGEMVVSSHMQDFIDCVRSRQTPRCGIDRAFAEAVTIVMSVESYFKERKVKWDPVNEVII
jgi:hypothetical protein